MHPELIKLEQTFGLSALSKIDDPFLENHDINLWIKRDDLLHPVISGNKWRKLKYSLDEALSLGTDTIISMGGAYSNHLHALAYVGRILGLNTIGIIRGERPVPLTPTLLDMENWGMELRFVSRPDYRHYRNYKHWQDLPGLKPHQYWLPEGGATSLALKGIAELVDEIDIPYDTLCVTCGTGATLAGLINAVSGKISVLGFAALKNAGFLQSDVQSLLSGEFHNWEIFQDYHFGGFAKLNPTLVSFMAAFEQKTLIPLEPVYTGKMLYGLYDLIAKGYFKPGQRIVAVHTGGLQGKRGYA
ncbi:1-aminocyclopropane-1-carboxylate deaminase/D-cysteine desulfhydrase [Methyloglobulus sp.]|uniref:1-aminocyclopropane-1-carboxylate deaminase/D-cysteine desulfhydrase n=1 Tax=Methyloglobulus sp. TaxID=2518622 RepID=UPI003989F139